MVYYLTAISYITKPKIKNNPFKIYLIFCSRTMTAFYSIHFTVINSTMSVNQANLLFHRNITASIWATCFDIYLRPLKRKFDFDVIFCRVVEVSAKNNNSLLKTIIFQSINGTETQKVHYVIKHHSMKEAYPQNFNRVKFIIHSNTFAGSITYMPTVCLKDHITHTPHRPHQTSDITQRESLSLSDGILKLPDISNWSFLIFFLR